MIDYIKVEDKRGIEHTLVICPVCGYFYDKDREETLHQEFHAIKLKKEEGKTE
jgi:hypothetical protein